MAETGNLDIINTLLCLINEYLNNEKEREDFQKYLRKVKYQLIYLNPLIESDLIEHDFNINSKIVWNTKAICNMSDVDEKNGVIQRRLIALPLYNKSLKYICENYNRISNKNYFDFMIILFRCSLLFFSQGSINEVLEKIYKNSLENFSVVNNFTFGIFIKEATKYLDTDRSKIEEISFTR